MILKDSIIIQKLLIYNVLDIQSCWLTSYHSVSCTSYVEMFVKNPVYNMIWDQEVVRQVINVSHVRFQVSHLLGCQEN